MAFIAFIAGEAEEGGEMTLLTENTDSCSEEGEEKKEKTCASTPGPGLLDGHSGRLERGEGRSLLLHLSPSYL